ncbi:hypothetical protein KP509_1Z131200 [Ceratopteris richardii]|nr:hypothetical protein KP509_1Z131200 [Ceratopteris richardii]
MDFGETNPRKEEPFSESNIVLLNPEDASSTQPQTDQCSEGFSQQSKDDGQGLIRVYERRGLGRKKHPMPVPKKRRRWLCEQLRAIAKCKQKNNFLNRSEEEIQAIKRHNEIQSMKKEAHFRKMFSSYVTGIIGDEGIMKEMNELVAKHDHMLANKRMSLHQQWHKEVYNNINEQVERKLKLLTSNQIKDKARYFHYQYLNASNQRLLFLDVVDHTFYDPFESLKYCIKYNSNLQDPLKHDLDKAKSEALIMGESVSKDLKSRKVLDPCLWDYQRYRSTLWGHFNVDEEDGSEVSGKNLRKWQSHDILYNTKFDASKLMEESPKQGKRIVPNQGKGWSFRERHEGKAQVHGLPCMTQPKLQLYYT